MIVEVDGEIRVTHKVLQHNASHLAATLVWIRHGKTILVEGLRGGDIVRKRWLNHRINKIFLLFVINHIQHIVIYTSSCISSSDWLLVESFVLRALFAGTALLGATRLSRFERLGLLGGISFVCISESSSESIA